MFLLNVHVWHETPPGLFYYCLVESVCPPDIDSAAEQFVSTLRTGKTPDGRELPVEFMPWKATQSYTDVELKALFSYLKSI